MNKANTQPETRILALVRMIRGGQITLPVEARKALQLKEGDYLEAELTEKGVLLKPVAVTDRSGADRELEAILSRVRYVGPEPEPSEDEVGDLVNREIHAIRAQHAKDGAR